MLGPRDLRRVTVFIASPSDVGSERDCIRRSVQRMDRLIARKKGFCLEPIGWEDIPAGMADRTQDIINQYVDSCDIFIGVLHRRFGSPTDFANSGTEEEYDRIERRWNEASNKPTVCIYFKGLARDDNGGDQYAKVVAFRRRIEHSVLYKTFIDTTALSELVEDNLSDWLFSNESAPGQAATQATETLGANDIDVLARLVELTPTTIDALSAALHLEPTAAGQAIAKLQNHGLLVSTVAGHQAADTCDAFVLTTKLLANAGYMRRLLGTPYCSTMVQTHLPSLVRARFQCRLQSESQAVLNSLVLLSPLAMSYLLYGDTSLYSTLGNHARQLAAKVQQQADEMLAQTLIYNVLVAYCRDSADGSLLSEINGKHIAGQVITIRISAAFEDTKAFEVLTIVPTLSAPVQGPITRGQPLSGGAGFFITAGDALGRMGYTDLAISEYDKVLIPGAHPEAVLAALNNKGLALLHARRVAEAISVLDKAVELAPDRPEPRENLELAKRELVDHTSRSDPA